MIVTINGKILKPKTEQAKQPVMSSWFKKWLLLIGGLFFLFFASASFLKANEDLVMGLLVLFLFGLLIFGVIVLLSAIITLIKKFLKFKLVIYY